jgi:hypothetical protein
MSKNNPDTGTAEALGLMTFRAFLAKPGLSLVVSGCRVNFWIALAPSVVDYAINRRGQSHAAPLTGRFRRFCDTQLGEQIVASHSSDRIRQCCALPHRVV